MTKEKMIELINTTNDSVVLEKIAKQTNVTYKMLEKIVSKNNDSNVLLAVINNKISNIDILEKVFLRTDDEIVLFRAEELTYEYMNNFLKSKMNKEERKNYIPKKASVSGLDFKRFTLLLNPDLKLKI